MAVVLQLVINVRVGEDGLQLLIVHPDFLIGNEIHFDVHHGRFAKFACCHPETFLRIVGGIHRIPHAVPKLDVEHHVCHHCRIVVSEVDGKGERTFGSPRVALLFVRRVMEVERYHFVVVIHQHLLYRNAILVVRTFLGFGGNLHPVPCGHHSLDIVRRQIDRIVELTTGKPCAVAFGNSFSNKCLTVVDIHL